MKYYLEIKRDKQLIFKTWMNLEITMVSERSQLQKAIYHMMSHIGNIQNRQTHRDRKKKKKIDYWFLGVGGRKNREGVLMSVCV